MSAPAVENTLLNGCRNSNDKGTCMKLYDEWAASYNSDLAHASQNYVAPILTAQAAIKASNHSSAPVVLDAGCGTGLVGEAMAKSGAMVIDGADLSPAMLKIAEDTGVYRDLITADLTQPVTKPDQTYDIITCCGTFTRGHVGPDPALREFVRLTKHNGIIVATILDEIWFTGGYQAEIEKLEREGLIRIVSVDLKDYRKGAGDKARLITLQRV